jgi:hypothetical protein
MTIIIRTLFFFFLLTNVTVAQTSLQPLVDSCANPCFITLAAGTYDDADPVRLTKDVTISGSRAAVVHSEFIISNGANVHIVGITIEMNKIGAVQRNGYPVGPFPQNGMIVVLNSVLWLDDVEMHVAPGMTFNKDAIYAIGGVLHLRSVTEFSRIDWRNNTASVLELLYGTYTNIFDNTPNRVGYSIAASSSSSTQGVIVSVGGHLQLSGSHIYNFGTTNTGVSIGRAGYFQCGAGLYTTIQGVSVPVFYDASPNTSYYAPPVNYPTPLIMTCGTP